MQKRHKSHFAHFEFGQKVHMFSNVFHRVRIILEQKEHKSNEKRRGTPIANTCAQKFEAVYLKMRKCDLCRFCMEAFNLEDTQNHLRNIPGKFEAGVPWKSSRLYSDSCFLNRLVSPFLVIS